VAAAVTYGIVVYKAFRARSRPGAAPKPAAGVLSLAADENVQYLGKSPYLSPTIPTSELIRTLAMALVWLFSPQYPLAMLPFGVYSIFHVLTYTRTNLIPTLQPPQVVAPASGASPSSKPTYKPSALADSIGKFVKEYYDLSMGLVAILEIFLWVRILLAAIIFTKGSWILLILYTAFLRARFAQSSFVQGSFRNLTARIDAAVAGQQTPPAARTAWETVKGGARSFHDVTDVGKYVNGAVPPVRKTS
jgi:hypothetical protein